MKLTAFEQEKQSLQQKFEDKKKEIDQLKLTNETTLKDRDEKNSQLMAEVCDILMLNYSKL